MNMNTLEQVEEDEVVASHVYDEDDEAEQKDKQRRDHSASVSSTNSDGDSHGDSDGDDEDDTEDHENNNEENEGEQEEEEVVVEEKEKKEKQKEREDNSSSEHEKSEHEKKINQKFETLTKREDHAPVSTELYFSSSSKVLSKRKKLKHSDLWELRPDNHTIMLYNRFQQIWEEEVKKKSPSLVLVLIKTFREQVVLSVLLYVGYGAFSFAPAAILPQMVNYLRNSTVPFWYGIVFTAVVVLCSLLGSLCYYHSMWQSTMAGLKIRAVMMASVYRKVMNLSKTKGSTSGQIVNLYAADSQLIFDGMSMIVPGLVGPLQLIASIIFLSFYVSWFSLVAVLVFAVTLPINFHFGNLVGTYRRQIQAAADVRLKLTTEFIQGIRIVKYYAWEQPFVRKIEQARAAELKLLKKLAFTRVIIVFLTSNSVSISLALVLLFYGLYGPGVTVTNAFTVIAILNVTRQPFSIASVAYLIFMYNKSSVNRVCKFLQSPEREHYVETDESLPVGSIILKNADLCWQPNSQPIISGASFEVHPGEKVMIVGKVGIGKSTLAMSILGEVPYVTGKVIVNGSVANVPQQAWIYNATVRDNILFGSPYDVNKYQEVVEASALIQDFTQFTAGDLTEIGDRGVNLSGGQKQRISIARALYSNKEIYILDDPLSAVDSHVSKYLFKNVIESALKDKTVIMVTNQLQYLPFATKVIFLDNGQIAGEGSFHTLRTTNKKFEKLMKKYGVMEQQSKEETTTGKKAGGKKEKSKGEHHRRLHQDTKEEEEIKRKKGELIKVEEKQSGLIPMAIYWYFIKSGRISLFWMSILGFTIFAVIRVLGTWWLNEWTAASSRYEMALMKQQHNATINTTSLEFSSSYWSLTYLGWLLSESIAFAISLVITLGYFSMISSQYIHTKFLRKLSNAVTAFFDETPVGRILSRLSQDLSIIDFFLSIVYVNWLSAAFQLFASIAGFGLGVWWILIALLPLLGVYFGLQIYFRKTNIEIQRLESVSRAPPISHLTSTLSGMDTIRAYGQTEEFIKLCDFYLDHNNVEKFALRFVNSWYGLRLDLVGTVIVFFVFGGITLARIFASIDVGSASIAMSFTSGFTTLLSFFSVFSSDFEIRMNSVERFWEYNQIGQESTQTTNILLPPDWPSRGEIEFEDFSFKYHKGPLVLKNISIQIKPNSKVAIVGRTGAGKSSLMQALYRIEEPANGTIVIDGIDFKNLQLNHLRSKIAIIPQEPTLFMASLRYNLDPFSEYSDNDVWSALEMVQLREAVIANEAKLEQQCEENGSNFSVGQRQLLCMARAVLKKSSILLLDEATASVDVETDAVIQATIRKAFKNCTVLTIAHRLNTIMDNDMILVLDKGEVVEYDSPVNLLDNASGHFYSMVQATGESSAVYLHKLARGEITYEQFASETSSSKGKKRI